jgi:hypothetical protein
MSHREARDDGAYSFVYEPSRGEQAMQAFIFTILDYFIFPSCYFKSVLCTIVILCFSGARFIGNRMYIIWSSKFRLLKIASCTGHNHVVGDDSIFVCFDGLH